MKSRRKIGKFSSAVLDDSSVKIQGAKYSAVDTKDGWYTLKDVLFFAEVKEGEKNAPKAIKAPEMQQMVSAATQKYEKEKFAAPAHKGHHKAIAFEDPEFLGFMLPKRVGRTVLDGREQDAIYGDVKIKASGFERVKKGELPFVSPEVDWESMTFSSLAFLDSMPPHFKGPLITVGKVTEDPTAKFTVGSTLSKGLFMALDSKQTDDKEEATDERKHKRQLDKVKADEHDDTVNDGHKPGSGPKDVDGKGEVKGDHPGDEEHDEAKMCSHCTKKMAAYESQIGQMDKTMADIHFKMGLPYKGAQMSRDTIPPKSSSSAPREDDNAKEETMKFTDDPEAMAKFAAQEARMKALEDKLSAKESEESKKARITAAFEELKGYPITDAAKKAVAQFAEDDAKLKTFIEVFKAQTPKDPPRTVSAFESTGKEVKVQVAGNDPDLASFQAKGQEAMEAALKYAARFEAMKQDKACKGSVFVRDNKRKEFIEHMMELDPTGNFGNRKAS